MANPKKCIGYIYPRPSSFVRKDLAILSKVFQVVQFSFAPKNKWFLPLEFLRQLIFLLANQHRFSVIVIQFAGYHAMLPVALAKLFGKPVLVVTGGTDCVGFPHIRYGNFARNGLGWATAFSLKNATHISSVHQSLVAQKYSYDSRAPQLQGYRNWVPGIKTPETTIYNGYDASVFYVTENNRPAFSFITVAANPGSRFARELKGLDLFFELAQNHPQWQFTLVGAPQGFSLDVPLKNLRLLPFKTESELRELYNAHQFYVQLSISEGFPNALTEAMFCGCIPVVSAVASMPFIADDMGVLVGQRSIDVLESALAHQQTFEEPKTIGAKTAARFPLALREEKLIALVNQLATNKHG